MVPPLVVTRLSVLCCRWSLQSWPVPTTAKRASLYRRPVPQMTRSHRKKPQLQQALRLQELPPSILGLRPWDRASRRSHRPQGLPSMVWPGPVGSLCRQKGPQALRWCLLLGLVWLVPFPWLLCPLVLPQ